MTHDEAAALATWINDHDTRFKAKPSIDNTEPSVQLTKPEDGTQLDPIYTVEDYGAHYIEQTDPSPTIRDKWETWLAQLRGADTYDQPGQ